MKPELELIDIESSKKSFRFFKREDTAFLPYWHYHPELELTLISKGKGTRFIGDSIQPFSDFDLVLVGENLPHHWVSIEDNNTSFQEAYVFQFHKDLLSNFPECNVLEALFKKAEKGIYFSNPSLDLIGKIMAFESITPISQLSSLIDMLHELLNDENQTQLVSDQYLNRFYSMSSQSKISKTTNYILEHLDKKLTVNHMAEYTHMVPQSFCRWFKKHSGHSFVSFLNKTRIERACHLLRGTDLAIQAIAFSCGFESLSHFNRTFKQQKQTSPSKYRKLKVI